MATTYTRRINLYINGKQVTNDIKSIRAEMSKLTNQQSRMTIGSREYNAHAAKIRTLRGVMRQHNNDLNQTSKGWFNLNSAAQGFNKYFGMAAAAMATLGGLIVSAKSAVDAFAAFDDKLADVRKVTKLSIEDVRELSEEIQKLDSRTSMMDRLELAWVAGKLGLQSQEDVLGFVKAADQIGIALGKDLGGIDKAVRAMGKLVDIFDLKKMYGQEQAMLKIGSAINELGMASTASEGYLVNFAQRVAGIAPQANVGIGDVLGLAATLDQLGQKAEMSSTAYSKLMVGMTKKTKEFASVAGMSIEEFTVLFNEDANEAMVRVFEGLKNNTGGFKQLVASLGDLGIEGQRMTAVFGALAKYPELLRRQQDLSNKSLEEGISVTNEFNIKNNTAQAVIDKAIVRFTALRVELGQHLMPVYAGMIKKGSLMIKVLLSTTQFLIKYGVQLLYLVTIITAYNIATKFAVLWQNRQNRATLAAIITQRLQALAYAIQTGAVALYNAALMLLSGNLMRAAVHFRVFSRAMMANPIGLIVAALAVAALALHRWWKKAKEAAQGQKELNDELQTMADLVGKTKYQEFLKEMNLYTDQVITMADGSQKMVKSFNENIDVLTKFGEKVKTLREDELEDFKMFFLEEIVNMQRSLKTLDPGSIRFEVLSAKILEFQQHLALVNGELTEIEKIRDAIGEAFEYSADFDTVKTGLEAAFTTETNLLKKQLLEKKLTKEGYNREMYELELAHLIAMRQLYINHGKEVIDIEGNILDHKLAWQQELQKLLEISTELFESMADDERKLFEDIDEEMEKHVENYKKSLDKETEAAIDAEFKKADARKKAQEMQIEYAVQAGAAAVENAKTVEEATKAILNSIRKELKAYLAEFIATAALKALKSVPFPLNIAAAAAAGGTATFLFNQLIPEFAAGKYNVTGESGNRYNAKWAGKPKTGMYGDKPYVGIFNEVPGQPEMVIDGLTTRKLRVNFPEILDAIHSVRDGQVPQFAGGKYPSPVPTNAIVNANTPAQPFIDIAKFNSAIDKLTAWEPSIAIELIERKLKEYNNIRNNSGL